MAISNNPNVVNSGLLFEYDMANTQKSWIGRPSTNTCNYSFYNYVDGNATLTRNATPPIAPPVTGYEVFKLQSNNGGNTDMTILYNSGVDQVNGGVYTHSAWMLLTAGTYCKVGQHWNPWDAGPPQYIPLNKWTRVSYTLTNYGSNYGNIANAYGTDGTVYITAVQYEAGSTATPFMGGAGASRSNTQALLDLTNNSTATAGNLVYNSDNTFNFSANNPSYVQVPLATAFNKLTGSINVWIYPTSYNGGNGIFVNRTDPGANAVDWLWIGPYSGTFYFRIGSGGDCCSNDNSFGNYYSLVPLNTWTNLCCTWSSGGTSCVYINGSLYQSRSISTIPNSSPDTNGRFGLGHANNDSYFNGKMPIGQIYNRQLTAGEVRQNFNAIRGRYGI